MERRNQRGVRLACAWNHEEGGMGDEADGFLKSERESSVLGWRERCCLNEEKDVFEWREGVREQ